LARYRAEHLVLLGDDDLGQFVGSRGDDSSGLGGTASEAAEIFAFDFGF